MRVAIVHDYFIQQGGAEKVAGELHRAFPEADMYALVSYPDKLPAEIRVPVRTSFLQNLPGMRTQFRKYFMLYPLGAETLDLRKYDLVLSSSSCYAKGVRRVNGTHICYCHTPTRWVWDTENYLHRDNFPTSTKAVLRAALPLLKAWDLKASKRPDYYIANSEFVARRIADCYSRPTPPVIHPPIDFDRFSQFYSTDGDYYLVLSRLIGYKRLDLAVQACTALNRKLKVVGTGPDLPKLKSMAGKSVEFLGRVSDADLGKYVSGAKALIFPGEEDFGMTPLELAAAGKPTIAYFGGGAQESLGGEGLAVFFPRQDVDDVCDAILRFENSSISSARLQSHARGFDAQHFRARMQAFVADVMSDKSTDGETLGAA
jgi:glycosyltransferase involved in cell wall biosynthesis